MSDIKCEERPPERLFTTTYFVCVYRDSMQHSMTNSDSIQFDKVVIDRVAHMQISERYEKREYISGSGTLCGEGRNFLFVQFYSAALKLIKEFDTELVYKIWHANEGSY